MKNVARVLIFGFVLGFSSCSNPAGGGGGGNSSPATNPGPASPKASVLYFAGFSSDGSNTKVPGYWKDGVWTELPRLSPTQGAEATSLFAAGNSLYAGGYSANSSGAQVAGYWKDGVWVGLLPIDPMDPTNNSSVTSIVVAGSDVYAGGWSFWKAAAVSRSGYWKNGAWIQLPVVNAQYDSGVNAMALSGTDVYTGGYSVDSDQSCWPSLGKNGNLSSLAIYTPTVSSGQVIQKPSWIPAGWVNAIVVSGSDVYAAGVNSYKGVTIAGYWKNGTWSGLQPLDTTKNEQAMCIFVSGSDIYTAGNSGDSNGHGVPGYWKNFTWVGLSQLDKTKDSLVKAITVIGTDVYAAGYSTNSSGIEVAGYWKNGTWTPLPVISAAGNSEVGAVLVQ